MGQTNISIRVDEDVKKDVEVIFSKLGLTLSAATNVFFRQVIMKQSIPFPLTTIDMTPEMQARKELGEAFREVQRQSVINGTDKMTMEEIDAEITAYRQEKREKSNLV